MFGFFRKRDVDQARRNDWKGLCPGCSHPIRGQLLPAAWRPLVQGDHRSRTGTLFACRCPSCGVELLAWEPGECETREGAELYWNMHAVPNDRGELITEDQVTQWSGEVSPQERSTTEVDRQGERRSRSDRERKPRRKLSRAAKASARVTSWPLSL